MDSANGPAPSGEQPFWTIENKLSWPFMAWLVIKIDG